MFANERPILGFLDKEKVDGIPNVDIPLVITVVIPNHLVYRILVGDISSCKVIFSETLAKLGLGLRHLRPLKIRDYLLLMILALILVDISTCL